MVPLVRMALSYIYITLSYCLRFYIYDNIHNEDEVGIHYNKDNIEMNEDK